MFVLHRPMATIVFVLLVAGTAYIPVLAKESQSGQDLHDFSCQSCHDEKMYTRENRIIKSMDSLKTQVQRCETTLDLGWFDEEIGRVAKYLNNKHYHFK